MRANVKPATIGVIAAIALILMALWQLRQPEVVDESGIEATTTPVGGVKALPDPERLVTPQAGDIRASPNTRPESGVVPVPYRTVTIRGQVRNASGAGLADIEVRIESLVVTGGQVATIRALTDERGVFAVAGLAPEMQYKLSIDPQQTYGGYRLDAFSANQADGLMDIVLPGIDLVDVDGMIVDTNLLPVADFELTMRSLAVEFPDRVIRSDSTGYFSLTAFPAGEVDIATNASDYFQIKGLELRRDEYQSLRLVIDRGSYHLSGWVGDDNDAPLAETQVTLKSAFETDGYHSFSYRSTITDENGAFEFTRLGGHPLTLGIYANGFETYIRQHEFRSFSDTIAIRLQRQG